MKTTYPEHKLTAETAFRIEQLFAASASLEARRERYIRDGKYQRSRHASRAASRLHIRAFMLLYTSLTAHQQDRVRAMHRAALEKKIKAA